jgi:hypothetical protein
VWQLLADLIFNITFFSRASTVSPDFYRYFICQRFSVSPQLRCLSKSKLLPHMSARRQFEPRLHLCFVTVGVHGLLHIPKTGDCRPHLSLSMAARRQLDARPLLPMSVLRQFNVRQSLQVSACRLFQYNSFFSDVPLRRFRRSPLPW